jgi:FMN-dependent oxidoreductase (nitrilotriacetate monooxygenase family)
MPKKMHLAFDLSFTHTDGRWRTPGSWIHRVYPDLDMFEDFARFTERGCIDMLFFGDGTGIPATWRGSEEAGARWGIQWPRQDMSPYITAMSRVTKHIGFGLTYSSTFMHPYYVARLLNSLDLVTGGRMAFNVVTSTRRSDAANYGFDELMEHNSRYERMEEFVDVCKALWASVEPDAFVWDRESGTVCEPDKIHPINHAGQFFKVRGPLSTVPSPQGRPVLIQAGGSPRGIKASAHFADHIFAASPPRAGKIKHRKALDEALVAEGRDPESVGMLFSTTLIVGKTEDEAKAKKEALLDLLPEEAVGAYLSHNIGYDFSNLPDRFYPAEVAADIAATQASPVSFVSKLAEEVGKDGIITREEFFRRGTEVATGYDRAVCGTPASLADFMEEEFEATGCRGGFMISHPYTTPRDMIDIIDFLIPELQRRGRFRTKYEGSTLRDNLAEN